VSAEELLAGFDLLPIAWCVLDQNLRFVSLSQKMAAVTGLGAETSVGHAAATLIPAFFAEIEECLRRAVVGEAVQGVEVDGVALGPSADGQTFVLSLQPAATRSDGPGGILVLLQDITEQKRAETAVRESDNRNHDALELTPHITWTIDPNGRIREVSPRALAISGLARKDMIRDSWLSTVHPDDRSAVREGRSSALRSGVAADIEYRMRMGNGTDRWVRSRIAPNRDADGRILRWYVTLEDIQDRRAAEAALRESEAFARSILDSSPDCVSVLDFEGRLLFMSGPGLHAMEIEDFARLSGQTWCSQWPPAGADSASEAVREARAGRTARFTGFRPTAMGQPKWWDVYVTPIPDRDGKPVRMLVMSRDVTEAKRAQDEIEQARAETRAAAERFSAVLESTTDAVILLDQDRRITYVNQHAAAMLAAKCLTVGGCLSDYFLAEDWGSFDLHFDLAMTERIPVAFEEHLGSLGVWLRVQAYPTADGGLAIFFRDVTDERSAEREQTIAQDRITHMARHDALTGLPNRTHFREQLAHALAEMRPGTRLAVLYVDLDGFKIVNDTFGHPVGDTLLREVAARLQRCVRIGDTVARFGGDEFAVLQTASRQPEDSDQLGRRLAEVIAEPYDLDGQQIVISTSIGIAVAPDDGAQVDDLIKRADVALYAAKAAGRSTYRFFERRMDEELRKKQTLKADLRLALDRGDLRLQYQPIVDLRTNRIAGFEALVRWQHPVRGLVLPSEFIPVAEESGLILPIGEWVLREACREAANWPGPAGIAVNLSPVQFRGNDLARTVTDALAKAGLAPNRLELEITESVLLQDTEANLALLRSFKQSGIRISMDDFGTGYSSLGYLRRFPFDKVKIDRSFISDLPASAESAAILRAVVGLGASLGVTTTAEGVETREQLDYLRAERCDQAQGYLFSRPVSGGKVAALIGRVEALAESLDVAAAAQVMAGRSGEAARDPRHPIGKATDLRSRHTLLKL
jgi:diguanylate cyclase (GGDEF)-like protein/PAS domain S-box-containing protein